MKALSIRQPWIHAIMKLGKRVENRDWAGCSHRGPVLLHASSRVVLRPTKRDPETFGDGVDRILEILKPAPGAERLKLLEPFAFMSVPMTGKHHGEGLWRPAPTLPFGGIVGRARIVDTGRVAETGHVWDDRHPLRCKLGCGGVWGVAYDRNNACPKESPWAAAGALALVLADVEPVPFIPWRGSLGFFEVPDGVVLNAMRLFVCAICKREVPWDEGASDEFPDACDDCAAKLLAAANGCPRPCTHVGSCGCASLSDL